MNDPVLLMFTVEKSDASRNPLSCAVESISSDPLPLVRNVPDEMTELVPTVSDALLIVVVPTVANFRLLKMTTGTSPVKSGEILVLFSTVRLPVPLRLNSQLEKGNSPAMLNVPTVRISSTTTVLRKSVKAVKLGAKLALSFEPGGSDWSQ